MIECGATGSVSAEVLGAELAAVLALAQVAVAEQQLVEEVVRQGAEPAEAADVVAGLIASGVLERG